MTLLILFLIALVVICGGLLAITPWLMRKNECFAVTVPESAQQDPRLVVMRKSYTIRMLVITAVCTVLTILALPYAESNEILFAVIYSAAVLIPIVLGFVLMLASRKQVQQIKAAEGWVAAPDMQIAAATLGTGGEEAPHAISLWWNLLYIPIIAACVAIPLLGYDRIPDIIPMHMDFAGVVSDTAEKSIVAVLMPALINLFLAICLVGSHAGIIFSKRAVNPSAPATSAYAYGMFARAWSIATLIMGLVLTIAIGATMLPCFFGIIPIQTAVTILLIVLIPIAIGAFAISIVYGQAGSRLFARMQDSDEMLFDDDEHWKAGIFYFNKDDPSIFLPERFGIGWTVNLARPATWLIFLGLIALVIGFVVIIGMAA